MGPLRRFFLGGAFVAAQTALGAYAAHAQKPGANISIDPATSTLGIGGWERSVAATGTTYYRCQAQECGAGSLVSVRAASGTPNAAGLEANARAIARAMGERLGSSVRVVVGKPRAKRADAAGISVGQIGYDFHGVDPGAGISPAWTNGFVAGPRGAFTVSSSAANRRLADRNMQVFQLGLMLLAAKNP